jgi:uncharacterized protein (TIGR02466 family)
MPGPIENAQGLLARGQPAEAYAMVQALLAREPDNLKGHFIAAAAAGRMGRKAEALEHLGRCRSSLSQGGRVNGYLQLARAYERVGAPDDALGLLETATRLAPRETALRVELADLLLRLDRYDESAAAARRAASEQPGNAAAWSTLGAAEHKAGRCLTALEAYRRAQALNPEWTFLNNNIAAAAIAAGDPDTAIETAQAWLAAEPGNAEALSFLALALHEGGRPDEARELFDFDRLVKCYTFDPPAGFTDTSAFNDAIESHVLSHPTLKTPRIDEPTWHHPALRISENLLEGQKGPLESLEDLMRQAVSRYREDAGDDPRHPFLAHCPDKVDIYAWAAVLEGEGNQHAHIHIDGYLSGCYYVRIPPEISSEHNGSDGPIKGGFEVGRPPEEIGCKADPLTRAIKPHEGLMVMFPAYLYHQTIPFKSAARRICVAFDVLPAGRQRVHH